MFGPDWTEGCPSCSAIADGFEGVRLHLENHDVSLVAVSRAPLERLLAYRDRMGWTFPWASSLGSDFNYDFHVSIDPEVAPVEYNYRSQDELEARDVSWKDWIGEQPGMSGFVRDGGKVFHAYSAYARGLDALWGAYQWLDRAPLGRNEDGVLVAAARRLRAVMPQPAAGRIRHRRLQRGGGSGQQLVDAGGGGCPRDAQARLATVRAGRPRRRS